MVFDNVWTGPVWVGDMFSHVPERASRLCFVVMFDDRKRDILAYVHSWWLLCSSAPSRFSISPFSSLLFLLLLKDTGKRRFVLISCAASPPHLHFPPFLCPLPVSPPASPPPSPSWQYDRGEFTRAVPSLNPIWSCRLADSAPDSQRRGQVMFLFDHATNEPGKIETNEKRGPF